jgi:CRISPR-associated protein Cas2
LQLVINSAGTYITQKAGLIRVQKSVFLGRLESNRFDELSEKCRDLIDEERDSVYLFPFCQEDFRNAKFF